MKVIDYQYKYPEFAGVRVGTTVRYRNGLWIVASIEDAPTSNPTTPRKFVRLKNRYGYYIEADLDVIARAEVVNE
jgi:hypothetical protein